MTAHRPDSLRVNVRLRGDADTQSTIERVLKTKGVIGATQMFPDETDPELVRMYLLDVKPSDASAALELLQQDTRLAYVESAAPRKLIH